MLFRKRRQTGNLGLVTLSPDEQYAYRFIHACRSVAQEPTHEKLQVLHDIRMERPQFADPFNTAVTAVLLDLTRKLAP